MSLTVNAKSYDFDSQRTPDSVRYNGPSQTLSVKDHVDLKRTAPKPTATFCGVGRGNAKLTRTTTDGTDPIGDGILEIALSVPRDSARAEQEALIDDMAAWLATAAAKAALLDHDINQ
jgi:hypothetical protein